MWKSWNFAIQTLNETPQPALLFAWYCSDALGQTLNKNSFYLRHSVSTIVKVDGGSTTAPTTYQCWHHRNEFNLRNTYLGLSFTTQQQTCLGVRGANRFELHQCLEGSQVSDMEDTIFNLRNQWRLFKNRHGNQIDQFDDSILWGLASTN